MQISLEFLAVISAAAFGVLLARSKQMDLIGVCCVAFIVAFGGGTLRDVLLDRTPLFWIQQDHYALTVFGLAILGSMLPRLPRRLENWLYLPDAIGMGMFSILGAQMALQSIDGNSMFLASLFGVITGTFGGVIGDIVCNEVPNLFRPRVPLYATCSFAGCWVYLLADWFGAPETVPVASGIAVVVGLRLAALRWQISLPAPRN